MALQNLDSLKGSYVQVVMNLDSLEQDLRGECGRFTYIGKLQSYDVSSMTLKPFDVFRPDIPCLAELGYNQDAVLRLLRDRDESTAEEIKVERVNTLNIEKLV
ncbi:MAG: hypothetical protein U9R08_00370 [Nanoarchaeota archaeon]|nr:hypothetical protein [Nanoarchaeota archaeon]